MLVPLRDNKKINFTGINVYQKFNSLLIATFKSMSDLESKILSVMSYFTIPNSACDKDEVTMTKYFSEINNFFTMR